MSAAETSALTPAQVYAIWGAEPEINAYAMAKYSRSALSLTESLREIDGQKAEKFLNTFYFQYGHSSIADLAHISFAIEKLSLLAAIEVCDETRWDGQERSTRYQQFRPGDWQIPPDLSGAELAIYEQAAGTLFSAYETTTAEIFEYLKARQTRPSDWSQERFERTLRARAFDHSRYLLPLATLTSLGQIVSARTLEGQIARLMSSAWQECVLLGRQLRQAACEAAWDPRQPQWQRILDAMREARMPADVIQAAENLTRPIATAPTLVKYTDPSPYQTETRRELRELAAAIFKNQEPRPVPRVSLAPSHSLELELAASLLYTVCDLPYQQILDVIGGLSAPQRREILDLGQRHRGRHDEWGREWRAGYGFAFDILQDVGSFRDLHRHRRCVQLHQKYTWAHGHDTPELCRQAQVSRYQPAIAAAREAASRLPPGTGEYLMPLAQRKRTLFKMDAAEAAYIIELRSAPGGHFAYREIAQEMHQELSRQHPGWADYVRVSPMDWESDLLRR